MPLREWINTYPGSPGDPSETNVAGVPALLYESDQEGNGNPTVYFGLSGFVFSVRGAVAVTIQPAGITRDDFDRVVGSISLP
jgi:hypothetical protein